MSQAGRVTHLLLPSFFSVTPGTSTATKKLPHQFAFLTCMLLSRDEKHSGKECKHCTLVPFTLLYLIFCQSPCTMFNIKITIRYIVPDLAKANLGLQSIVQGQDKIIQIEYND